MFIYFKYVNKYVLINAKREKVLSNTKKID